MLPSSDKADKVLVDEMENCSINNFNTGIIDNILAHEFISFIVVKGPTRLSDS